MTAPAWTRLGDTPLWSAAERAHRRRFGRVYHDWGRVLRLYHRADRLLCLPYDRPLDLAILSHSAVIDLGGDRRSRSAAWLRTHAEAEEPVETACSLILNGPYRDMTDTRLPLLELSDLAEPGTAERAVLDMVEQVKLLTRLDGKEVWGEISDELNRIRRALSGALPRISGEPERDLARRIIEQTDRISRLVPLKEIQV